MKKCKRCNGIYKLTEFHKDSKGKYGVTSRCKKCQNEYRKEIKDKKPQKRVVSVPKSLAGDITKKKEKTLRRQINRHSVDASTPPRIEIEKEKDIFELLSGKNYRIFGNSKLAHFVSDSPHISIEFSNSDNLMEQLRDKFLF